MIFILLAMMICCLCVAAIRKLSAPRCDHQIGLVKDYEGDTLYRLSELGDFRELDEIFAFCPDCGARITVTNEEILTAWDAGRVDSPPADVLTVNVVARHALKILHGKISFTDLERTAADLERNPHGTDKITVRLPNRYNAPGGHT